MKSNITNIIKATPYHPVISLLPIRGKFLFLHTLDHLASGHLLLLDFFLTQCCFLKIFAGIFFSSNTEMLQVLVVSTPISSVYSHFPGDLIQTQLFKNYYDLEDFHILIASQGIFSEY